MTLSRALLSLPALAFGLAILLLSRFAGETTSGISHDAGRVWAHRSRTVLPLLAADLTLSVTFKQTVAAGASPSTLFARASSASCAGSIYLVPDSSSLV